MNNPKQFYFPNAVGAEADVVEQMERINRLRNELGSSGPA
jgi:hypothetical protein